MPAIWLNDASVTAALQQNPQMRSEIAQMLQTNGDNRTPEQWLLADLEAGDTNSAFIDAVQGAHFGTNSTATVPTNNGGTTTVAPGTLTGGVNTNTPATTTPGTTSTNWTNLLPSDTPTTTPSSGGNYNQVQNSSQGGSFGTTGSTTQVQSGQSGQDTSSSSTGTQTGTQTGTNTSTAVDTLGMGALLKDATTGALTTDAARNTFLTDVMNTGGQQFGSQVDQAVRGALSGPGMTGAGDSARARAAGYAGAQVGRTNMADRLAASTQLAGPTALTQLSTAANPFVGTSNTTSGTTSNTSSQSGNQSSTSWQDMVTKANEIQSGLTQAASTQSGSGQIPSGQPVKTGGCVLCTAGIELGFWKLHRVLRTVIGYKLGPGWPMFRRAARGYFAVFGPFADWLLDHPRIAKILSPLARKVVYEELRVSGRKLPFRLSAWLTHWVGDAFCRAAGFLPVAGYVKEQRILDIAKRNNILFKVQS